MDEIKKLNLRQSNDAALTLAPEAIPTLVPAEKLAKWMDGDSDPYFKIQEIEYPTLANGYTYTEDFWLSFVSKMNERPIPGSKSGHETSWGKRAPTDLLLVGGKVESAGNGKGKVYLKNYIPPVGDTGDNAIFIKENQTGMVDYSIVSYTRDSYIEDKDGNGEWMVVESLYGERNDAVEYACGAMEMKSNIKDKDIGEKTVKKDEILTGLTNLKENQEITLPEIAKHLNLSGLVKSDEEKASIAAYGEVKALCGEANPKEFVLGLIEEKKANAVEVRKAKMDSLFGPAKNEKTEKTNDARVLADALIGSSELTEEKINEVKGNETFKKLLADQADHRSKFNIVDEPAPVVNDGVIDL